ncbi:hypothetical protein ACLOJK_007426 [Asimina triloba]
MAKQALVAEAVAPAAGFVAPVLFLSVFPQAVGPAVLAEQEAQKNLALEPLQVSFQEPFAVGNQIRATLNIVTRDDITLIPPNNNPLPSLDDPIGQGLEPKVQK